MRGVVWMGLSIAVLLSPSRIEANDADGWTWGVAVGMPQLVALTLEKNMDAGFRIQGHASTLLLLSSAGIRAMMMSPGPGAKPYAYVGGGVFHIAEGEGGGAQGTTGYGCGGVGVRFIGRRWQVYGEVGAMGGLDRSDGYEAWQPSVAVGVAFGGQ